MCHRLKTTSLCTILKSTDGNWEECRFCIRLLAICSRISMQVVSVVAMKLQVFFYFVVPILFLTSWSRVYPFFFCTGLSTFQGVTSRPNPTHIKRVLLFPVIYVAGTPVSHPHHYTNPLLRPIAITPSSPLVPCYSHPQAHFQLSGRKARN